MFGMENLGSTATSILLFVAVASTVIMWWSWFAAIRKSRGYPPFDEIASQRRYVGYESISRMSPEAKPYVRRHFVALVFFFLTPVILMLFGA